MIRKRLVPVLKWLGYTRRERRASLILLFLIITVLIIKNAVPPVKSEIREISFRPVGFTIAAPTRFSDTLPGIGRSQKTPHEKIELNSSDSARLVTLPGIGPVLAGRIIRFRNLLGGYFSVDQIREVYGLKEETFILIRDRITVDSSRITRMNLNSAGYREMVRHPYLEPADVQSLVKYRELKGNIDGPSIILRNNLVDSSRFRKIRPYLRYE